MTEAEAGDGGQGVARAGVLLDHLRRRRHLALDLGVLVQREEVRPVNAITYNFERTTMTSLYTMSMYLNNVCIFDCFS